MHPRRLSRTTVVFALAFALPSAGAAQVASGSDESSAVATVEAYHRALETGDTTAVRALLADDVLVAESGGLETREEYLSHHLPADMAFAAAVTREPGQRHVAVQGDGRWRIRAIHWSSRSAR